MKTSTNFALALIPSHVWVETPHGTLHAYYRRHKYSVSVGKELNADFDTELELWRALDAITPAAIHAIEQDESVFNQGLATRAGLIISNSPDELDRLMQSFRDQMLTISKVILESLDTRVKNKLVPRRVSPSRGLSELEVRASVFMPHLLDADTHTVSIRLVPSPLDNNTFRVTVSANSKGMAFYEENQRRIKKAFKRLEGMGIMVDDITAGTAMYLG